MSSMHNIIATTGISKQLFIVHWMNNRKTIQRICAHSYSLTVLWIFSERDNIMKFRAIYCFVWTFKIAHKISKKYNEGNIVCWLLHTWEVKRGEILTHDDTRGVRGLITENRVLTLTYNSQLESVTKHWAGVYLALILASIRVSHILDYQLPLPSTQILSHHHAGILQKETVKEISFHICLEETIWFYHF